MNCEYNIKVYEQTSIWAEQLKTDPAFTDSDIEELKCHLIDIAEDLRGKGLNEEEAFIIATSRLGDASYLKFEFEEVNMPVIMMRKTILVLSGILAYFFLYFLMVSSTRLLVILLNKTNDEPQQNIGYVIFYIVAFHFSLIISTLIFFLQGKKMVKKAISIKIRPQHTIILFWCVVSLIFADLWLIQIIKGTFEIGSYTNTLLYPIFDYCGYSFPAITILCYIILYKRYYFIFNQSPSDSGLYDEFPSIPQDWNTELPSIFLAEKQTKNEFSGQLEELINIGLDENEAWWIAQKRNGLITSQKIVCNAIINEGNQMYTFLIILSGVLIYFLLYFLLFSSARIFFTIIQYFENDPLLNIKRTWSFVLIYQSLFIFFTINLYLLNENFIQRIKQIRIKPTHTLYIFFTTIALAITDRCFYPITKNSIGLDYGTRMKFYEIFFYSNFSFPLIILSGFLMLFYKYYRDNSRILKG